jgi:hypothetical protein
LLILAISVAATVLHGAERSHAAIGLERSALVQNRFARAPHRFRQRAKPIITQSAPAAIGLGDIAGKLDAAIGNQRDAGFRVPLSRS